MAFPPTVAKAILTASGNQCLFPGCEQIMLDRETATIVGEAAHICGENPGSARYNPSQDPGERQSFWNGIALCGPHHKIVDDNEDHFTVELLQDWKVVHEQRFANQEDRGWLRPSSQTVVYIQDGVSIPVEYWIDREGEPQVYTDEQLAISYAVRDLFMMVHNVAQLFEWNAQSMKQSPDDTSFIHREAEKVSEGRQNFLDEFNHKTLALFDITFAEFWAALVQPRKEEKEDFQRALTDLMERGRSIRRKRAAGIVQQTPPLLHHQTREST